MRCSLWLPLLALAWSPALHAQGAREVVDAEHAFAARAKEAGVKAAFLEYLLPDAVIFRPGPVRAHDFLSAQPARPTLLLWRPALAGLSRAGDLGFSTGPSEVHAAPDQPAASTGWYVTVWQRQADGSMRAVIDHGIAARAGSDLSEPLVLLDHDTLPDTPGTSDLRALDAEPAAVHERVRTYAGGVLHTGGVARAEVFRAAWPVLRPLGSGLARSADLGYTYGAYTWGEERGHYVRVWRRAAAGWQVVVDLFAPDP